MRERRALMVGMERVWNTVAVGGVLGALLTTAGAGVTHEIRGSISTG